MLRAILEPALLFGSPFAAYVIYLALRRKFPFEMEHWSHSAISTLALAASPSPSSASLRSAFSPRAAEAPISRPMSKTAKSCRGGSSER